MDVQPSLSQIPYSPTCATSQPRITTLRAPSMSTAASVWAAAWHGAHSLGRMEATSYPDESGVPFLPLNPARRGESANSNAMFSNTTS